jgi:hypothetical protein
MIARYFSENIVIWLESIPKPDKVPYEYLKNQFFGILYRICNTINIVQIWLFRISQKFVIEKFFLPPIPVLGHNKDRIGSKIIFHNFNCIFSQLAEAKNHPWAWLVRLKLCKNAIKNYRLSRSV